MLRIALLRRAEERQPSGVEQPDARTEQQSLTHVVRDEHHRLTEPACEGAEFALQLEARDRVERAERLVEQQEWWIESQSACHTDALALAAGKLVRKTR